MPVAPSTSLTFYPACCFPLSPTFNTWVKLTAAEVHELSQRKEFEVQKIYFHLNHPIRWIRLVGMIVAADIFAGFLWAITLDDSSGRTIEVVCKRTPLYLQLVKKLEKDKELTKEDKALMAKESKMGITAAGTMIDMSEWDVGMVVKVKGGIGTYRGENQVALERISAVLTTDEEVSAWAELQQFRTTVLSKPWVLSAREERKLKEKMDGTAKKTSGKMQRQHEREEKEKKRSELKREPLKDKGREQVKNRASPLSKDMAELRKKHKELKQEMKKKRDVQEVWL